MQEGFSRFGSEGTEGGDDRQGVRLPKDPGGGHFRNHAKELGKAVFRWGDGG